MIGTRFVLNSFFIFATHILRFLATEKLQLPKVIQRFTYKNTVALPQPRRPHLPNKVLIKN